jgi:hypothetical protein
VPRHDHLEDAPVDLPVPELQGPSLVHAKVGDVQPVTEVIEHEARLASVSADRAGLPQRVNVADRHLLSPVTDGRGETMVLRRRSRGEQRDVAVGRAHAGLVRRSLVGRH